MAIGLGRMLGFVFPENFLRPYEASTVTDFWRRWHVTLSSWFRDYVYIPLVVCRGFSEGGSSSLDLGDDVFGGLGPGERLGVVVPR